MDVLVKWDDKTLNVVSLSDLQLLGVRKKCSKGQRVRMFWKTENKYYYGTIQDFGERTSDEEDVVINEELTKDSDDDVPLSSFVKSDKEFGRNITEQNSSEKLTEVNEVTIEKSVPTSQYHTVNETLLLSKRKIKNLKEGQLTDSDNTIDYESEVEPLDDSDADPTYEPDSHISPCEVTGCKNDIWSSCHVCLALLCYDHFMDLGLCSNGHLPIPGIIEGNNIPTDQSSQKTPPVKRRLPEDFEVQGSEREEETIPSRRSRNENKRTVAHEKRTKGKEYISPNSGRAVPCRILKARCYFLGRRKGQHYVIFL